MSDAERSSTFIGPHEGREFELMRDGKKHLSKFLVEFGQDVYFPEGPFDRLVEGGILVKDEQLERSAVPDGGEIQIRNVLYATAAEAWRIPAMRLVEDVYRSTESGWRPDLERVIGSLLGYDQRDIELFIERLSAQQT